METIIKNKTIKKYVWLLFLFLIFLSLSTCYDSLGKKVNKNKESYLIYLKITTLKNENITKVNKTFKNCFCFSIFKNKFQVTIFKNIFQNQLSKQDFLFLNT